MRSLAADDANSIIPSNLSLGPIESSDMTVMCYDISDIHACT